MMKKAIGFLLFSLSGLGFASSATTLQAQTYGAQLASPLSQEAIIKAIQAATHLAKADGRAGSFVLVDTHGETIASYRMPGALPSTYGFSKSKAVTAVGLGIATDKMVAALPPKILSNILTNQGGKYVIFPGGFPVYQNGQIIAGVAFGSTIVATDSNVGNAKTPHQNGDVECAKAALAILESKV
jgi:uncharacterized protein GlcG (DUF336 family)